MTVTFPLTLQKQQDSYSQSNLSKEIKMKDI